MTKLEQIRTITLGEEKIFSLESKKDANSLRTIASNLNSCNPNMDYTYHVKLDTWNRKAIVYTRKKS